MRKPAPSCSPPDSPLAPGRSRRLPLLRVACLAVRSGFSPEPAWPLCPQHLPDRWCVGAGDPIGRADSLQDTRRDTQSQAGTRRGSRSWRKCLRWGSGRRRAGPRKEAASGQLPDGAARMLDGAERDVDPGKTAQRAGPQRGLPRDDCPPHRTRGSLAGFEASERMVPSQVDTTSSPGDEAGTTAWAASKQGPMSILLHALLQPRGRL